MRRTEWLVCIDESGNFDLPADRVCLGGLLLQEADSPALRLALKTQLDVIFPHLDYPPHATCYNRPSQHLVAWKRLSQERRMAVPLGLGMLLDKAENLVLHLPGAPAELSSTGGAPLLSPPLLARLDDWLRLQASGALDPLRTVRTSSQTKLEQLFAELTRLYPGQGAVVAAAEVPSASPPPSSGPDRYLNLLGVLFERLIVLLHSGPPGPRLVVRVASRGVRRPTGSRTPLTQADVLAAYQQALRTSPPGVDIEFQVQPPEDYDAQIHPGLVLADAAMNRLRSLLGARDWSTLARQVKATLQLPAELFVAHAGQDLPTIAAHTAHPTPPGRPGGEAGWVEQQAAQWASTLKALRHEEVTS